MPLCINSVYHGVTVPWFGFDNAGFAVLQTTARLGIHEAVVTCWVQA